MFAIKYNSKAKISLALGFNAWKPPETISVRTYIK
jgi:hypothetical protein